MRALLGGRRWCKRVWPKNCCRSRASTVVVTIRETMARTRGRIAKMRVEGGRRVVMAWLRRRLSEAVAEVEREVVVRARRQRRVVPHNLRVVIGLGDDLRALRQPGTLLASP